MAEEITFIVAAVIMVTGALGVVGSRNPVHSALFLIQTLVGVALIFIVQEAHFLAAVQVVVYAGAIVILFLFVIMLLGVDQAEDLDVEPIAGQRPLAAVIGAALLGLGLVLVLVAGDGISGRATAFGERALNNEYTDVERIGRVLFSDYALSFEITAGLLTIAVIGAVVLTRSLTRDELLEDLERDDLSLPAASPFGANDSDIAGAGVSSGESDVGSGPEESGDGEVPGESEVPSEGGAG